MSQEKVTKYKEEKVHRKETMKKQKRASIIRNTITSVVVVLVLGWVGYSGVTYIIENRPRSSVDVDYTAISDYEDTLYEENQK